MTIKATPKKKPSKANAEIMKRRGAAPFNDKSGAPRSLAISKLDLESYWNLQCGLKWLAERLLAKKILPATATEIRLILDAASKNIKMRMQKHGKWIEKREEKHEYEISDKLAACLLKVQGSSPEQLKKIQGKVNKIVGGLRE